MAVTVLEGDLFQSGAQTLVNTVNCVGVMGKGVALEFKRRFPEMYEDYVERCRRGEVRLGRPYLYRYPRPPWVLNFPTKDHWRSVARVDDIVRGLEFLLARYREGGITSLAVPPLGCGNGQLEWRVVGPTLYRYLSRMEIPVWLYAPLDTPPELVRMERLEARSGIGVGAALAPEPIRPAWVALVEILRRLEEQLYHWPTGRVIFQKLAYVATDEGLPTGLRFVRSSYGPFAADLRGVVNRLVNNGLIREARRGRLLEVRTGGTFADARREYARQLAEWEPIIVRTSELFMRLDTTHAEIVATVMFAARHLVPQDPAPTELDVYNAVLEWKVRRQPPLSGEDVALAVRSLAALGWTRVAPSADLPLSQNAFVPA